MLKIILLLCVCIFQNSFARSNNFRFGVITKQSTLPFFQNIKRGCMERASELSQVSCEFAEISEANPRLQELTIKKFVKDKKIHAMAIAVINSDFMKRSIEKYIPSHIPIITVDADFSKEILQTHSKIRRSYVGTDNFELGYQLGELFRTFTEVKTEYCIISGHSYSDNLNKRIKGFETSLSKSKKNLFSQNPRCPLYSLESSKKALKQMDHIISLGVSKGVTTSIILTGGWPQLIPREYRSVMSKYSKLMEKKRVSVFSIDTLPSQIDLLQTGLSQGNVGQRPIEMGRQVINVLYDIVRGKKVKKINSTGVIICTPEKYKHCL